MSDYHYRYRLRDIPGAAYYEDRKVWVFPMMSLPYLRAEFDGEIYFRTPLWKLLGEEKPEKKPLIFLGPVPDVPALALKPYDYQADGIRFMIDRLNNKGFVLNGDGVGLGKTLQAIGCMKWFVENRGCRKILIICKKSIKRQWEEEIRRIACWNEVPIFVTGGNKKKRMKSYDGIQEAPIGILITNYQNFLNDAEEINKVNYDICVIDEAHCIKGRGTKMNTLIGETVSGKRTILLTGTPVMSKPDDIFGIVSMVAPKFFGTYKEFEDRYLNIHTSREYGRQIIGAKHLDELQDRIQEFLIMRTAEEVSLELPKRRIKKIICNMDETQRRMFEVIDQRKEQLKADKEMYMNVKGLKDDPDTYNETIEAMTKKENLFNATLQYITDDPMIFKYYVNVRHKGSMNDHLRNMVPKSYKMSAKTEALIDIISELADAGEKAIIFCHWKTSAKMLRDRLNAIPGVNTVMYTGDQNDQQRDDNVKAFRNDPNTNVIIGTDAMAEGLNLQVCAWLINYEQADTHAVREQRIGRIHRIGSVYEYINIVDLVTEDDRSKDVRKLRTIERNDDLASAMTSAEVA